MIKIKNLYEALRAQMPLKRAFRNFFITGNAWGMFSISSHINQHTGSPKVKYNTRESAVLASMKMSNKTGRHFSVYKCVFCDGWHIGKNRDNQ